jgi:EAL domain-containing protein (putative c-di-GMP-specific phosphodiesterase class I)
VREALADAALAPGRLTLEITESVLMHDGDDSLAALLALKALGVRLAIDDFGTGYSSLSQLQRFPVDELKIDKAFVDGVAHGETEAALARTVIALGATLNLRTVAEGIESAEQQAMLHALGCDVGQGFHFARPVPATAVPRLLARPVG